MMSWFQRSLFRRMFTGSMLPILLGFGIIGLLVSISTMQYLTDVAREDMLHQAKYVNVAIQNETMPIEQVKSQLSFLGEAFNKQIMVFDVSGKVVATSSADEVHIGREVDASVVQKIMDGQEVVRNVRLQGEISRPVLNTVVPWGKEDKIFGGIVLSSAVESVGSTFRNIREIVLWALLLGGIITTVLVSFLSWSITRPLKHIEYAATEIALGNYEKRVDYPHLDEIGELTNAFNRMAEKLNEIEKHRKELEHRRDDFIANTSHELRTPLTAMQGFIEALQDGLVKDEDSRQKYYQVMYDEVQFLSRLVNELMDVINLKNRKVKLEFYYIRIEEVIQKIQFSMGNKLEEQGNELQVQFQENLPSLLGDADRIEQIMRNLIENANKFTENGQITITVLADERYMTIHIRDTGLGIPSHDLDQIWDRFFKMYPRDNRKFKHRSTGLGLAIVKELVDLHRGSVHVKSQLGEGTTFTIRFPLQTQEMYRE